MPNWTHNVVRLTGPSEKIDKVAEDLGRPRPRSVDGEMIETPFSFWNLIAPTDLDTYFGGGGFGVALGWYEWNIEHWGCKWDASRVTRTIESRDWASILSYSFDTPWGPPWGIFDMLKDLSIVEDLILWIRSEDEEGRQWTLSFDGRTGESAVVDLDVPKSHADYVDRGMVCCCGYASDPDEWEHLAFLDCPPIEGRCAGCDREIHLDRGVWVDDDTNGDVCGVEGGNEPHRLPEPVSIADSASTFLRCFGEAH